MFTLILFSSATLVGIIIALIFDYLEDKWLDN